MGSSIRVDVFSNFRQKTDCIQNGADYATKEKPSTQSDENPNIAPIKSRYYQKPNHTADRSGRHSASNFSPVSGKKGKYKSGDSPRYYSCD